MLSELNFGSVDLNLDSAQPGHKKKHPARRSQSEIGISNLAKHVNKGMEGILSDLARYKGDFKPAKAADAKKAHRDMFKNMHEELLKQRVAQLDDANVSLQRAKDMLENPESVPKRGANFSDLYDTPKEKVWLCWEPKMNKTRKAINERLEGYREEPWKIEKSVRGILGERQAVIEAGKKKYGDIVARNAHPERLRHFNADVRQSRISQRRENMKAVFLERSAEEKAKTEARNKQLTDNYREKTMKLEIIFAQRERDNVSKKNAGRVLRWLPLITLAGRLQACKAALQRRREIRVMDTMKGWAAKRIQRLVERAVLAPRRRRRIQRGMYKLKLIVVCYLPRLRKRMYKRASGVILEYMSSIAGENPIVRAFNQYVWRMTLIQKNWRIYAAWRKHIVEARVAQLAAADEKILAKWARTRDKVNMLLDLDPHGGQLGALKDFDHINPPPTLDEATRHQMASESFKTSQELHNIAMVNDRFLFTEYLQELKKRVAMDKASEALGRPPEHCRTAQALDAPVRPEFRVKLPQEDLLALLARGNKVIHLRELQKAQDRAKATAGGEAGSGGA